VSFDLSTLRPMVRSLSELLLDATDAEIDAGVNLHAGPRVRLYILTATDGANAHIFYTTVKELTENASSDQAEDLVDDLMLQPSVAPALTRIVAALVAHWLLLSKYAVLDSQQKAASFLEKQAMADLDRLVRSPVLKTAVADVLQGQTAQAQAAAPMTLYLALDGDDATLDSTDRTLAPQSGATQAGRIRLVINGQELMAAIAAGDTPIAVASKLLTGFESLPEGDRPNCNLAVAERSLWPGKVWRTHPDFPDGTGVTLVTSGAGLTLLPRQYDAAQDLLVATVYLEHLDGGVWKPGVAGLLYGVSGQLLRLTRSGPHAIAADLQQGKTTSLTDSTSTKPVSDAFFFQVTAPDGLTTVPGSLTYRVNELSEQTLAIPAGANATDLAHMLAVHMAGLVGTQRVLGAVRPSAVITRQGSPENSPALEIVAYALESSVTQFVMTIVDVPGEVVFAVVQRSTFTEPVWDDAPKSVVIKATVNKPTSSAAPGTPAQQQGDARVSTYEPSPRLRSMLEKWGKFGR
jgi:hypothetical protein